MFITDVNEVITEFTSPHRSLWVTCEARHPEVVGSDETFGELCNKSKQIDRKLCYFSHDLSNKWIGNFNETMSLMKTALAKNFRPNRRFGMSVNKS